MIKVKIHPIYIILLPGKQLEQMKYEGDSWHQKQRDRISRDKPIKVVYSSQDLSVNCHGENRSMGKKSKQAVNEDSQILEMKDQPQSSVLAKVSASYHLESEGPCFKHRYQRQQSL